MFRLLPYGYFSIEVFGLGPHGWVSLPLALSPVGDTLRFDFRVPSSLWFCGVFTAQTEKTAVDLRVHGSEGARDAPKALFEDVEQAARLRLGRYLEPRRLAAQAVGGRNVLLAR